MIYTIFDSRSWRLAPWYAFCKLWVFFFSSFLPALPTPPFLAQILRTRENIIIGWEIILAGVQWSKSLGSGWIQTVKRLQIRWYIKYMIFTHFVAVLSSRNVTFTAVFKARLSVVMHTCSVNLQSITSLSNSHSFIRQYGRNVRFTLHVCVATLSRPNCMKRL